MGKGLRRWWLMGLMAIALVLTLGTAHAQVPVQPAGGDAPPLLVNRLWAFEIETEPTATGFALWPAGPNLRHEVWYRITGGDALFEQRLRVYKEEAPPRPIDELPPPDFQVDEIYTNRGTSWRYLGFESDFFTYYFESDHRRPGRTDWGDAFATQAQKIVYENGDRYEILFEDQESLDDYNDLMVEVLIIRRHRFPRPVL